jgi:hypothetical protein
MKIRLRRRIATVARLALALGCIAGCETTDPFGVFYDVRFRVSPNSPCDDIARTLAANLPLQIKYNSGVGDSRGCDASMSLLDTKATVFVRIFKRPDLDHISVDTRQLIWGGPTAPRAEARNLAAQIGVVLRAHYADASIVPGTRMRGPLGP